MIQRLNPLTLMRMKRQQGISLFLLFILSLPCYALPSDSQKPLLVTSDYSSLNYQDNTATNIGHVIMQQGSSKLTADKVITYYNSHHKIIKIISYGHPARYQTQVQLNTPILYTSGETITFYPTQNLAILEGNATARRGHNFMQAKQISYNTKEKIMLSSAELGDNSYARITVTPQNNASTP
ncbi:MAG: lipopolysaccharide transport periplasmic protein LptA [Pseudomonadota bacterium]